MYTFTVYTHKHTVTDSPSNDPANRKRGLPRSERTTRQSASDQEIQFWINTPIKKMEYNKIVVSLAWLEYDWSESTRSWIWKFYDFLKTSVRQSMPRIFPKSRDVKFIVHGFNSDATVFSPMMKAFLDTEAVTVVRVNWKKRAAMVSL